MDFFCLLGKWTPPLFKISWFLPWFSLASTSLAQGEEVVTVLRSSKCTLARLVELWRE